jgi:hypothetical protein
MPVQLFTYYIENPLMIISINSWNWGGVMVIGLVIDFGELVKVSQKRGGRKRGGLVKRYGGCWVLWPLCVFGFISFVVVEGVCVRDCLGLIVCS